MRAASNLPDAQTATSTLLPDAQTTTSTVQTLSFEEQDDSLPLDIDDFSTARTSALQILPLGSTREDTSVNVYIGLLLLSCCCFKAVLCQIKLMRTFSALFQTMFCFIFLSLSFVFRMIWIMTKRGRWVLKTMWISKRKL